MPITDNLVLRFDQDGRELVSNTAATSTTGTATSTQTVAGASRTVRGYGATMGVGASDRIRTAITTSLSGGAQTVLAWIYVNGSGGSTYGRVYQKGTGTNYHDAMFMNGAATSLNVVRLTSAGGSQCLGIPVTSGGWRLAGFTTTGATAGTNPAGMIGYVDGASVTAVSPIVPTATAEASAAYDLGNRSDGARGFDGRMWQVAMWDRVLSPAEIASVYADWSQLDGGVTISCGVGNAVAAGVTATITLAGNITINCGVGNAVANGVAATISVSSSATLLSPADRGTVDFVSSVVTPNGLTPNIFVRNRALADSAANFSFFAVSGVNGMTPVFDVDRSNMAIPDATQKWLWSYTGELGSWQEFTSTTRLTSPNVYRSSNTAAFNQDTVYVAMNYPWRVGYTLPWLQSLESSGHISYAPSGGGTSYQFETRSATTNGATSGAGDVIAAQPLYSCRIGTAGNAPDGQPKRKMVIISGQHAGEDVGNYCLKGAVEFLVSADAQAVLLRQWFEIFVYPLIASAGRAGGQGRGDFENANKTLDVNRQWGTGAMETVNKHMTAIQTDAGSVIDVSFDFHGDYYTGSYDYWHRAATKDQWLAAMQVYIPGFAGQDFSGAPYAYTNGGWMRDAKVARFPTTPEYGYVSTLNVATLAAYGANHMRATAYLVSAGAFDSTTITCTVGNAVAAGITADIPGVITIGCTVGNAVAAGAAALIGVGQSIVCGVGNAVASGVAASILLDGASHIICTVGNAVAAGVPAAIPSTTYLRPAVTANRTTGPRTANRATGPIRSNLQ